MASSEFRQRIISAIVLILIALVGVLAGEHWAILVLASFGVLAANEWRDLLRLPQVRIVQPLYYVTVILSLVLCVFVEPFYAVALLGLMTVVIFGFVLFIQKKEPPVAEVVKLSPLARAVWAALGVPYIAGGVLALLVIREWPLVGLGITLYLLLVVWGADIGGYLVGRWVGGPKLCPAISPSKTWSGLFGGIALAVILGVTCALAFHAKDMQGAVWMAVLLAIVAQVGDLFESYLKRRCGAKDSGRMIPGHGGVLDRIDGLLAAALFLVSAQIWRGEIWTWW